MKEEKNGDSNQKSSNSDLLKLKGKQKLVIEGGEEDEVEVKRPKIPTSRLLIEGAALIEKINNYPKKCVNIDDLPDHLIDSILSFLPSTKLAIRTSLVSKQWIKKWINVSVLIFNAADSNPFNPQFSEEVKKVLSLHTNKHIKKFHIYYDFRLPLDQDLDVKLLHAINAEELVLFPLNRERYPYFLPQFIVDNDCLIRLELSSCMFRPGSIVNWSKLTTLKLGCSGLPFSDIANAVSRSPSLEILQLFGLNASVDGVLQSNSLKTLSFFNVIDDGDGDNIQIKCKKLEKLFVINRDDRFYLDGLPIDTIDNVFDGCPMLSYMNLSTFRYEGIHIASESLKTLILGRSIDTADFEILCPNLEELWLYDFRFDRLKVKRPNCDFVQLKNTPTANDQSKAFEILQLQNVPEINITGFEDRFIRNIQVTFRKL